MHLAVFGGTGHTGRHLLDQALRQGHTVTALARDPDRLVVHERLRAVADSRHRNLYVAIARVAIRSLMRDKEGMEELIRASDTAWTVVRPAILTGGRHTGHYRTGTDLRLTVASRISYADVADFMLAQLADDTFVRRAVAITS
ncbi:NAD(P)-dependent oxidoreductase [Frankia sp. QA3]|uniref:NAD(P)-dependent oxidoreductase n=1 Tax=Frankia sp. QA3 TaxID=710111 RepID=UPI000269C85D|nr:NAD(P)H-binding protein [Frankia sp. QA3]EIV93675.1 NmrA-like family protein [Frankia sp. QA3]